MWLVASNRQGSVGSGDDRVLTKTFSPDAVVDEAKAREQRKGRFRPGWPRVTQAQSEVAAWFEAVSRISGGSILLP
jgi:hypothetical protein